MLLEWPCIGSALLLGLSLEFSLEISFLSVLSALTRFVLGVEIRHLGLGSLSFPLLNGLNTSWIIWSWFVTVSSFRAMKWACMGFLALNLWTLKFVEYL